MKPIQTATVLGSGTMGAQIAAHLANAGLEVLLLDLSGDMAARALRELPRIKPQPFYAPERLSQIRPGSFDDLQLAHDSDWILEAVVEDASIKESLLSRVDAIRGEGSTITSNTSGLSLTSIGQSRSEDFRRHFFGTHFFNPPRYLRLLELIPTADTEPSALFAFERFAQSILGKGVVRAKDTPNFIANRIGIYAALQAIHLMTETGMTIEEVDRLTGTLIGRPKTATFRTIDLVGLDIFVHVAENIHRHAPDDPRRSTFEVPPFIRTMLEQKRLGLKTGQGFYKKHGEDILTLDPDTMEYGPGKRPQFPSLEMIASIEDTGERLRALMQVDDRAANFVRQLLMSTLTYTAECIPAISDDIVSVDRAMRWGFSWDLGPFELWDALGIRATLDRWRREGGATPELAEAATESGGFYRNGQALEPVEKTYRPVEIPAGWLILKSTRTIRSNAGASLRDLGDGIACLEFHSKMNTIGGDAISMLFTALDEVEKNFEGLVIGSQGANFSAGANLMLLMMEAVEGNWDEIDRMVRTFQRATQAIRYSTHPIVAAPFGLALGGGCELVIAAPRVQAAAETYIGLVEVGAGLIPAAGGTTEMLRRSAALGAHAVREVFENIGLGKVSSSAEDARRLRYLTPGDGITMNPDRLIADAKNAARQMASSGFRRPARAEIRVFGAPLQAELKLGIHLMRKAGHITDYEAAIAERLAFVLCGGDVTTPATAPEQYFLDLEREAFVWLCRQPQTLARIEHLLKKGKVLRN